MGTGNDIISGRMARKEVLREPKQLKKSRRSGLEMFKM